MASSIAVSLVHSRPRFLQSKIYRNIWINASCSSRLSSLSPSISPPSLPPLPLRLPLLPPPPPLLPLRRFNSPHFRPSLVMTSSDQSSNTKTDRVVIKGRVQGVFYRNWTIENATELGLKGWVRNRRDGSVEALFSGSPEKVKEMEERCRRGPPDAVVTGLEVFPSQEDPGSTFERKPTA